MRHPLCKSSCAGITLTLEADNAEAPSESQSKGSGKDYTWRWLLAIYNMNLLKFFSDLARLISVGKRTMSIQFFIRNVSGVELPEAGVFLLGKTQ